jgi:hypothetical protein
MKFDTFERRAREEWERIPEDYKTGVDGVVVAREAKPHPDSVDVYTLGECVTESYPSDFGGPDTTRSWVVLYYGSFRRLSRMDDTFDWEEEIWETLTHELQHHLESLADEEALLDLDYAMDQGFRRAEGEPFDPFYYRGGTPAGEGVYRVEKTLYIERPLEADAGTTMFEVGGVRYRVPVPAADADVVFVDVTAGLDAPAPPVTLVLVRRHGWREAVRALFRRREAGVCEVEATAERVDDAHGPTDG